MYKLVFIYWGQGFENAPDVVSCCIRSWEIYNPDWKIQKLDDTNIRDYIDVREYIPDIEEKNMTRTSYSDILRLLLLNKYGGCWCDATLLCNMPLDNWLPKCIKSNFFVFSHPCKTKLISSWFIYSIPNGYVIGEWTSKMLEYWSGRSSAQSYFWVHKLFKDLWRNDNAMKKIWMNRHYISAKGPHLLQERGLLNKIDKRIINIIYMRVHPVYKLTYKLYGGIEDNCILNYLKQNIDLIAQKYKLISDTKNEVVCLAKPKINRRRMKQIKEANSTFRK